MYWFTADEHYGHANIIKYCDRPFHTVEEMGHILRARHNEVVGRDDIVVHAGDFVFGNRNTCRELTAQLTGKKHIFLRGSHDNWMGSPQYDNPTVYFPEIWERLIEGQHVVVCHYAMLRWVGSHRNSWQLFGHSHGKLNLQSKQWDVGVDNNDFRPVSFERLKAIMAVKPNNPNYYPKGVRCQD